MANKRTVVKGELESNQQSISARSDDVGPSDQFREPSLEPKHKIFLSHSGADKDFTEQLCEDLERVHYFPFFDKRPDSLPKGEKFPPLIFEAAKQCRVAVVVLSEEFFTRSKWPMMELTEFVKAQESTNTRLKILPLFLGITMEQFKETARREHWLNKWQHMASKDDKIDVKKWEHALAKVLGGINVMEYNGVAEGHVSFRKKVVGAVCKLVQPDLKWDVSNVRSMNQLCKPILHKLEEVESSHKYGVRVVGLYGMGGVGKTTISKAICNQLFGDFDGKSYHVGLGSKNQVKVLKTVLRELTEASPDVLRNAVGQLHGLLKTRMCRQKVFIVLDNVLDNQIKEAQMYLEAMYHDGSIVLVTSRSLDILVQQLHIRKCDCIEMPELKEDGAIDLFFHYTKLTNHELCKNDHEIIKRYVKECWFIKGDIRVPSFVVGHTYHYHPLALEVLGKELGTITQDVSKWEETLEKLRAYKFNMLKYEIHEVFSVLRLSYDTLLPKERLIFLDLALILATKHGASFSWSSRNYKMPDVWKWLCIIHGMTQDAMKESMKALKRKGLLNEMSEDDQLECEILIHDLYQDFAESEAREGPFQDRRFLLDKEGSDVPRELLKNPSGSCWPCLERLIIHKSKVQSLKRAKLHRCSNVEVLQLFDCSLLEEVDVTGMDNLRCMELTGCYKLGQRIEGVEKLSNLVWLRWVARVAPKFINDLSLLTALQVLKLGELEWPTTNYFPPNLSGCMNLQELNLTNITVSGDSTTLGSPNFGKVPKSLLKINLSNSSKWVGSSPISSMTSFTNLQDLNLQMCQEIDDLTGLNELISLQKLNVAYTRITELPDLMKLKQLHFLDVSNCKKLTQLVAIAHATALRHVDASLCVILKELPNLGKLEKLQSLDLLMCEKLTSLVGIAHATSLRYVDASRCMMLTELPDDLSKLENLEMLNLSWNGLICTLPNGYEVLAERNILKVEQCWGLVVPLVKELQQQVPERSHIKCVNSNTGCVSSCKQSIQSCIYARKDVSRSAYDLLKGVFSFQPYPWSYLLDDGEIHDFVVRALCEHDDRGGTDRLSSVVADVTMRVRTLSNHQRLRGSHFWIQCWAVVVTAPCTFEVVTERTMLEPSNKTLIDYTLNVILPQFVVWRDKGLIGTWVKLGIEVVLQKCKEKLDLASEQGIDPVPNLQMKMFVDFLLRDFETLDVKK